MKICVILFKNKKMLFRYYQTALTFFLFALSKKKKKKTLPLCFIPSKKNANKGRKSENKNNGVK